MPSANTGYVSSVADLRQLADKVIAAGQPIALDCETGYEGEDRSYRNTSPSLHPEENIVAGYNFTNAVSWGRYVPLGHDETRYNLDPVPAARALWDITATGLCVVHNADMEERNLSRFMLEHLSDDPEVGAAVRASRGYFPILSDTMMEAHALAKWKSIALKSLSRDVFGYEQVELIELFNEVMFGIQGKKLPKNKKNTLRFNVLDPSDPRVFDYACDDVIQTLRLHQRHYPQVKDNFIYWLEMNNWPVIWGMEDEGLEVDWDFIDEARGRTRDFQIKMQAGLANHLIDRLGQLPPKFNPNSHPQIRKILYSKPPEGFGLFTHIMTKGKADGSGKQLATSALALKGNSADPFVRRMQDYRGLTKLLTTYLETWRQEFGWCDDGRAHCHLLPHGTPTGRFSCTDFNYQNLPKKYHYECDGAEFSFNFRDSVIVPPGYWGMGFDISQGELRIIAAEAGEQAMLDAFAKGEDLHILTAMRLLGLTKEEVLAGGELNGVEFPASQGGFRPFGKAQPLSVPVLTPDGWVTMGDLRVGDRVFGSGGFPVRITGVFPQGVKRVYRVTTSDGAVTECCAEHLWTVRNINSVGGRWRTCELRELLESGLRNINGQPKYVLPPRPVIHYPDPQELTGMADVDPYVMGLLLGDGGFTQTVSFTNADSELLSAVKVEHERNGGRVRTKQRPGRDDLLLDAGVRYRQDSNVIRRALRRFGLLGLKSHSKFIPVAYMQGSPESRLALLQGLMDTDGTVLASGAQFRVTSEQLARDAQELARSLGGWASIRTYQKERSPLHTKSDPLPTWDVYLRLPDGMCPFRLSRKKEKWKPPRYVADQRIVSVEEVMPGEVRCISVDASDGLYVTSDYIVTHNTMNFALMGTGLSAHCAGPG
jgi:DNA polymerase I-like protein with 3'-5' exonuclease and polymerase domains